MKSVENLILTIDSESEADEVPQVFSAEVDSLNIEKKQDKAKHSKFFKIDARKHASHTIDEGDDEQDLNPNFQFEHEGYGSSNFEGWNFHGSADSSGSLNKKSVNLDEILKRKGGLTKIAGMDSEEEEEDGEEMDDSNLSENDANAEDTSSNRPDEDDELALNGFGSRAYQNSSESDEESQDNKTDESDGNNGLELEGSEELTEDEEDEAALEEAKKFYADESESKTAKEAMHVSFQSLQLSRPLIKGLAQLGYSKPSPIQSAAIPIALMGRDIVAGAVTGSGKTAAFMIPIIERLIFKSSNVSSSRVLVLVPTRELAVQVFDVGKKIGAYVKGLSFGLAVGGLNLRQQEQQLKERPDIVIATPGRLIDHIRNSPSFSVDSLEILVMDEADRMLEEGFQAELTEILSLMPKQKRQTMLFSATMNTKVQDLIQLSLNKPVRILINPPKQTATRLSQEFVRIRERANLKPSVLFSLLRSIDPAQQNRTVVFVSRKESAHKLRVILGLLGLKATELHGALSQEQRLNSVNDFKTLAVPILICTDLAARGLDIPKIEFVINYDMPKTHEIYLHRVGRTARAGREGKAISLVSDSNQERKIVKEVLKSAQVEDGRDTQKVKSRSIDWKKVEEINSIIESKGQLIDEVLEEEKNEKELLQAEMELNKASNMIKHQKEIQSRPKRTWFESNADKKSNSDLTNHLPKREKKINSKKRKSIEALKDSGRSYKKTKQDRIKNSMKSKVKNSRKKGRK